MAVDQARERHAEVPDWQIYRKEEKLNLKTMDLSYAPHIDLLLSLLYFAYR